MALMRSSILFPPCLLVISLLAGSCADRPLGSMGPDGSDNGGTGGTGSGGTGGSGTGGSGTGGSGTGGSGTGGSGTGGAPAKDAGSDTLPPAAENPCPATKPTRGQSCTAVPGYSCFYDCAADGRWVCMGGTWQPSMQFNCQDPAVGPCPATEPAAGASCASPGLACTYGEHPRRECRPTATCMGGLWQVKAMSCPKPPPADQCPATLVEASEKSCMPEGAFCTYPSANYCKCDKCTLPEYSYPLGRCVDKPIWQCEHPHTAPGCPQAKPNLGAVCAVEKLVCAYHCGGDGGRLCFGGAWRQADGGFCAISSRRFKRDIRYLGDEDLRRLATQVDGIRLARYRYNDAALGPGERLGFIIEDHPDLPAVDAGGRVVDLYSYASMLAAAVQVQGREIRALRREVARMNERGRSR